VSLMSRKNKAQTEVSKAQAQLGKAQTQVSKAQAQVSKAQAQVGAGWVRAREAAAQVTPLAKNAGATAAKNVQGARGWAAPRIEQAAQAVQNNVAPKVSGMLSTTAQWIEPPAPARTRRMWPRVVAVLTMVTAAGGAITAAVLRRRSASLPDDVMTDDMTGTTAAAADTSQNSEGGMTDAEALADGNRPAPGV
jgi:hypothetical protein